MKFSTRTDSAVKRKEINRSEDFDKTGKIHSLAAKTLNLYIFGVNSKELEKCKPSSLEFNKPNKFYCS